MGCKEGHYIYIIFGGNMHGEARLIHRQSKKETRKRDEMSSKLFTYIIKIVRRITTLRPSTLIAFGVGCVGAVASTRWRKGINRTGWSLLRTIHTTVLKTALRPTIDVARLVRGIRAITIPGHTNVTHGLQGGTLCVIHAYYEM